MSSLLLFFLLGGPEASTSAQSKVSEDAADEDPPDPSKIPIYLTEAQKELLFSFIVPVTDAENLSHKCIHCGAIFSDIKVQYSSPI